MKITAPLFRQKERRACIVIIKSCTDRNKRLGGGNPILIQSMTDTKTEDVGATVRQILELEATGCDIIRCAVPTMELRRH